MMRWKQKDRHTAVLTLKDPLDRRCSIVVFVVPKPRADEA